MCGKRRVRSTPLHMESCEWSGCVGQWYPFGNTTGVSLVPYTCWLFTWGYPLCQSPNKYLVKDYLWCWMLLSLRSGQKETKPSNKISYDIQRYGLFVCLVTVYIYIYLIIRVYMWYELIWYDMCYYVRLVVVCSPPISYISKGLQAIPSVNLSRPLSPNLSSHPLAA